MFSTVVGEIGIAFIVHVECLLKFCEEKKITQIFQIMANNGYTQCMCV